MSVTGEQCREGLEACLRHGWLRVVDQAAADEVRSLLEADPALLALPRTAAGRSREYTHVSDPSWPGGSRPVPIPDAYLLGQIDFTQTGAALFRAICAEWLGPDWEDDLEVSNGHYREVHYYCESDEGFADTAEEHVAKGDVVRAHRVVPLGPWCVRWWERFPAGYRLELELGEP